MPDKYATFDNPKWMTLEAFERIIIHKFFSLHKLVTKTTEDGMIYADLECQKAKDLLNMRDEP